MVEKNAIIEKTVIEIERDSLSVWLHLKYDVNSGQGFGGYSLYYPDYGTDNGGRFLYRVMEVVGVYRWNQLDGKAIRVKIEDGLIKAIGNIIENDWFFPEVELR